MESTFVNNCQLNKICKGGSYLLTKLFINVDLYLNRIDAPQFINVEFEEFLHFFSTKRLL